MDFSFGFGLGSSAYLLSGYNPYNPLINYDWSTTTTSGLRYLKDVGSTPTYNASMYFGRGAYLNGVDQTITVPINTTIQTALKRVNGVVTISETSQVLTNYVISGLGVHKDYYLFTRLLTTAEKDSYTNTPELFYAMAQADSTCVLNMPMCETSSTARNYKTGIDYPITNYTTSVRDNAKNLQYGLQTCKFVRDSLGVIQSASDYLECDGVGYGDTGWIPSKLKDWTIEVILPKPKVNPYEGIGIENGYDSIWIRRDKYGVTARYGNGSIIEAPTQYNDAYIHISCVLNSSINTVSVFCNSIYSGVSKDNSVAIVSSFTLGKINKQTLKNMNNPLRLFKVHNKALTQAEITANYNSYVAKGLLV